MKVIKWLDEHLEETVLVALLVIIACVELMQVVARNVPFMPALTWAEELCRFAWIATVFLSLPYTIRKSNMLRVSVLIDALPPKLHNALNILVDIITGAMMGTMAYYAVAVFQRIYESGETSPAMLWPMWIMYLIVVAGFILATLRSLQMMVIHIIHFNEVPPTSIESQMEEEAAEEWVRPAMIGQDADPSARGAVPASGPASAPKGGDE